MFRRRKPPLQQYFNAYSNMLNAAMGYPSPDEIHRSLAIVCPARIWSINSEGRWFEAACVMVTNAKYPGPHAGLHVTKGGINFTAEDAEFFMKIHRQATETE